MTSAAAAAAADTTFAQTFLLPDLGEGLTEAEVVRWLVTVGEIVVVDQVVVEVETAKSVVEVPTPYAGTVAVLHGDPGKAIGVGRPLITIIAVDSAEDSGPAPDSDAAAAPPATPTDGRVAAEVYLDEERAGSGSGNVLIGYGTSAHEHAGRRRRPRHQVDLVRGVSQPATSPSSAPAAAASQPQSQTQAVRRVRSPLVRRLARDLGLDLARLAGTGEDGLVTRDDVLNAATAASASTPVVLPSHPAAAGAPQPTTERGERRTPMSGFRKTVAAALSRSRAEIPEATVWVDVDATPLVALRDHARTLDDPGPGLLAYLARFTVEALKAYPVLNGAVDTATDELVAYDHINLGLAVQTDRGLLVPAVLDAHTMTTAQLDAAIRDLTARAREGKATPEELIAGTFTLNNYGSFDVDGSAAIINHPQVAILGLGRIIDRPWVVDGEVVARQIAQLSFVFDHRVCDGGTAAGFMRKVADAIENPVQALTKLA